MGLDVRSKKILDMIVNNPMITGKNIEEAMNLSRKQLGYSIQKINDYLHSRGFDAIERQRTGKFIVPTIVIQEYGNENNTNETEEIVFSERERVYLIPLITLNRKQELSSYDFSDLLQISKNTFLLDLKRLQPLLNQYHLLFEYSREDGYKIVGDEFDKRMLMTESIRKMLSEIGVGSENQLIQFCNLDEKMLEEVRMVLGKAEKSLNRRLTDERYRELVFILATEIMRAKQGKILTMDPETLENVIGTEEYIAAVRIADHFHINDDNEVLFITLLINISNTSNFAQNSKIDEELTEAALASIANFEDICCVELTTKDQLLAALLVHIRPAYFRVKYNFHVKNEYCDEIISQYSHLHEIVRKATTPLAELIGSQIPDNELAYLTILFGSWLKREGLLETINEKKRAVVVCSKGVTVSTYLYITLSELLPEIEFVTWLSQRDLKSYRGKYDLVFTTERLNIDKKQIVISTFFNNTLAKQRFREKVLNEVYGSNYHDIQVDSMIEIVSKYADIHNIKELRKEFEAYVKGQEKDTKDDKSSRADLGGAHLSDLLNDETIMINNGEHDWEQVITDTTQPLIDQNIVEPRYLKAMIDDIKANHPYNSICPGLFIAHAGIDEGVNEVGMSILLSPYDIDIDGYFKADIIVVLATPNNESHLTALYELIDITEDQEKMKALRSAKSISEIKNIISR